MKRIILLILAALAFCTRPAFAEVVTTPKTEGYAEHMYIAGNPDNYPIEYYDEELEAFCGVIPDLLAEISEKTGIDFVYINGGTEDREVLGENLQVDAFSSETGTAQQDRKYIRLISYEREGEIREAGITFTPIAAEDKMSQIKAAADGISADTRNGIYLAYAARPVQPNYPLIAGVAAVFLLLVILLAVTAWRVRRLRRENELDKMTDAETGMGNLQFFKYHFMYTIGDTARSLYHVAYIVLDSSYLRSYYGDSPFEEMLKHTAAILSEYTGDREISARIAENGFAFAFQSDNSNDAMMRLEEIMKRLNSFTGGTERNGKLVFHAAVYPLAAADNNCELLLFNLRKNCNRIFGTEKQILYCDAKSMNRVQEEKKITESILKGFDNNEFKMYLQFIVDNKTRKIVSAEALSRWDNREKGLIGPVKYIESMEKAWLISKHDLYMFECACRQLEKWRDTEYGNISISCNFTRITLSEKNFAERLGMIVNSYSFDKSKLSIEITEDAIEKDWETAMENVRRCKELGFKVYLDDLGSGYTSLANLCDYPIDVVKIDRDILLKTNMPKGKELFSGIISLAHSLSIQVICEGVETEEQNCLVSASDCDYIQGWYYSKPIPPEECEDFIRVYSEKRITAAVQ